MLNILRDTRQPLSNYYCNIRVAQDRYPWMQPLPELQRNASTHSNRTYISPTTTAAATTERCQGQSCAWVKPVFLST
eukprot:4846568-Amphidinium_carterae.1